MSHVPSPSDGKIARRDFGLLKVTVLVVLTVWVSRFLLAPYLGYYGDDYAHFTPGMDGTIQSLFVFDKLKVYQPVEF